MQTNALSRGKIQVALLAEPKTPLDEHSGGVGQDHMCAIIADSLINEMCGGFFVHTMKHCYATA